MKHYCKKCNSFNITLIRTFEKYFYYNKDGLEEQLQSRNYKIPDVFFCRNCENKWEKKNESS